MKKMLILLVVALLAIGFGSPPRYGRKIANHNTAAR